ncbi:hypothetical protein BJ508DRAFT_333816 [Ascobolus immersus RN42]|uniref:Uncharacterized protein n=1 Tax=Ascobolus immersus RN42 TaxID=1160509 RepID=A0A3N4HI97_ASCIM|nr:hypothetical protein BJ508DRAFT_333816 [Ascobolus immersus RN42]
MAGKLSKQKIGAAQRRMKARASIRPKKEIHPNSQSSSSSQLASTPSTSAQSLSSLLEDTESSHTPSSSPLLDARIRPFQTRLRTLQSSISILNARRQDEFEHAKAAIPNHPPPKDQLPPIAIPEVGESITADNIAEFEEDLKLYEQEVIWERMKERSSEEFEIHRLNEDPIGTVRRMLNVFEKFRKKAIEAGFKNEFDMDLENVAAILHKAKILMEEAVEDGCGEKQFEISSSQRRKRGKRTEATQEPSEPKPSLWRPPTAPLTLEARAARIEARRKALGNSIHLYNERADAEQAYAEKFMGPLPSRRIDPPTFLNPITARTIDCLERELQYHEEVLARERLRVKMCEEMDVGRIPGEDDPEDVCWLKRLLDAQERYLERLDEFGLGLLPGESITAGIAKTRKSYESYLEKISKE